jgi:hypothetical protein
MGDWKLLKFTGIGSRRTPPDILETMRDVGRRLCKTALLRSGGADGADMAFEEGCDMSNGKKEIFLPWKGFNNNKSEYVIDFFEHIWAYDLAYNRFPWIQEQKKSVQNLIARNMQQVLGENGDDPVDMVICWTDADKGGTNYAMTIARDNKIPVHNMYEVDIEEVLKDG